MAAKENCEFTTISIFCSVAKAHSSPVDPDISFQNEMKNEAEFIPGKV